MKKIGVISLLLWVLFRTAFHSFSFDNSDILTFLYFGGNDLALIGLFLLLRNYTTGIINRITEVLLIYSGFCLITDILMLSGVGTHDFWGYTAISISILSIGVLWVIYA
jgi:hypothetical protein